MELKCSRGSQAARALRTLFLIASLEALLGEMASARKEYWINFSGPAVGLFERDEHVVTYLTSSKRLFTTKARPSLGKEGEMEVYWTQKASTSGVLDFALPLEPGYYDVSLLFAENYHGAMHKNARLLNVVACGCSNRTLLRNYDIFTEAGERGGVGVISEHKRVPVLNELRLILTATRLTPLINGLVVQPSDAKEFQTPTTKTCANAPSSRKHKAHAEQINTKTMRSNEVERVDSNAAAESNAAAVERWSGADLRRVDGCVNDKHFCTCVQDAPVTSKCYNEFNSASMPMVCELGSCQPTFSCTCEHPPDVLPMMCRKRSLGSQIELVGGEGLPDGFFFCVRTPRNPPAVSIVPVYALE